jgi:hypothetical protein
MNNSGRGLPLCAACKQLLCRLPACRPACRPACWDAKVVLALPSLLHNSNAQIHSCQEAGL